MPRSPRSFRVTAVSCLALVGGACALAIALGAGSPPPAGGERRHGQPADHAEHAVPTVLAYYLPTCAINTEEEMNPGRAVVMEHEGREVRFCCEGCVGTFEEDPAAALAKIDQMMIEDQLPLYPLTDCLVMEGHEMGDDAVNMIYKNRLVRFCCEGCIADFEEDPEKYLQRLDQAAAFQQGVEYPLAECAVAGHALADGEHPMQVVVGGRIIRLCCPDCMQELLRNPAEYVAMIDKAWADQRERTGRR